MRGATAKGSGVNTGGPLQTSTRHDQHGQWPQAGSVEEFEVWDGMLHEVIAQAAHNSFVTQVFTLMNHARAQGEWGMLKKRSLTPERRLAYQREHRALVQAIRQRDPVQARALAPDHLQHVQRNLLGFS